MCDPGSFFLKLLACSALGGTRPRAPRRSPALAALARAGGARPAALHGGASPSPVTRVYPRPSHSPVTTCVTPLPPHSRSVEEASPEAPASAPAAHWRGEVSAVESREGKMGAVRAGHFVSRGGPVDRPFCHGRRGKAAILWIDVLLPLARSGRREGLHGRGIRRLRHRHRISGEAQSAHVTWPMRPCGRARAAAPAPSLKVMSSRWVGPLTRSYT